MTERKRASGFVLMDAAFISDAKFRRLERMASNPADFAASVGVWWMLLADCRRSKSPFIDWDDYTEYSEQIEKLKAAHLLDQHGFDPEPFERWAPAYRSVSERTPGTKGTQSTESTNTSGQVISGLTNNGNARANEPLTEKDRDSLLQENLRLMNDPKVPGPVRRAAEHTVALLREGRKSA